MANKVGSGRSVGPDAARTSAEAARAALEGLAGAKPAIGFLFASPSLPLGECLRSASQVTNGARLIGCSTAGEFTEKGLSHGGVVVMLVSTDSPHLMHTATGVTGAAVDAARELCKGFHPISKDARQKGYACSTTVTLVDGLS